MRAFPAVFSCVLVSAGALAFAIGSGGGTDPIDPPPPPVNSAAAGVLYRAGLSADTLAASGVTAPQVGGILAAALAQHDPAQLQSRDQAHAQAAAEDSRLSALARAGLASPENLAALATARAALAEAETALTTYLDAMRTAACLTVSAQQSSLIQASRANRSWDLPPQYLVKPRSEVSWVALREALDTKRISEDYGYEFPPSAQSALASVDSEPEVALAKSNLDANIAAVQTAWNTAASD